MRPIILTMTAFGPYADKEIVDFRDAVTSGLFGIYGSTGSGKSTIFSAMTFALFGEASRNEQDTFSLRSDHAADDVLTQVEFIFEVGASRYLIRRTPDQMRPAKRGEGETTERHKAWLFDVTGIDPDSISDETCGKMIAEKKVRDVKSAVQERLGYGADQFRQIVLLPQGKFETFLTAKTDERMKILRELFDVSLYQKLASTLKEEAKATEDAIKINRRTCANRLMQEGYESPDVLKSGIAEAKSVCDSAAESKSAAIKAASVAEKAASSAKDLDAKFSAHEAAQTHLSDLTKLSSEMTAAGETLEYLTKAQSLLDVDDAQQKAEQKLQSTKTHLRSVQAAHETAKAEKMSTQESLTVQEALSESRDEQRKRVETLQAYAVTLKKTGTLKTNWEEAQAEQTKSQTALKQAKALELSIIHKHKGAQDREKAAHTQLAERNRLDAELTKAKQIEDAATTYVKAAQFHVVAKSDTEKANAEAQQTEARLANAETGFDEAEAALAAVQAQHLASKLVDGEPCSVCGSDVHPSPASGDAKSAGLDQAFREAGETLKAERTLHIDAEKKLATAKAILKAQEKQLNDLAQPDVTADAAAKAVSEIHKKLTALGPTVNIPDLERIVSAFSDDVAKVQCELTRLRAAGGYAETAAALAKQSYDTALEEMPEPLQIATALMAETQSAETIFNQMQAAYKKAQDDQVLAQSVALSAQKDVESEQKALDDAAATAKLARDRFLSRLKSHGLTIEAYDAHKANIDQIKAMSAEIDTFKEKLAIAQDRAKTTTQAIKDKVRPDLAALHQASLDAEAARTAETDKAAALKAKTNQLQALLKSISDEMARIEKAEIETAELRELAALFNANNAAKLDLETFAIGAMFDRVLQAANLRLKPMTSERYSLERELEGKGGGRRGLGICVHDIHTGKARATSTLSGGETFIAALALALGLSDIVESVSGKIRLDTIFIDEGFGSLDTDNDTGTLDQVLQTLQDLVGANRAVGLISHVQPVQNAIPNGFTIKKTATGSHVEARGL